MLPFDPYQVLQDSQGRVVQYLRLSVTDRCNYRCVYCMPATGVSFVPRKDLLRFEETVRLASVFVRLGVNRLRMTGGEPLLRRDLAEGLVAPLAALAGVKDVSLTTNGHLLERYAGELAAAGLRRVNVSLDTLDPERFRLLTRGGDIARVLRGIEAAAAAGLGPIKLNAVVLGDTDDGAVDWLQLVRYAQDTGAIIRFVEYMPIGVDDAWRPGRYVPLRLVREALEREFEFEALEAGQKPVGGGPANYWNLRSRSGSGSPVRVGFIAALSRGFCETCNRVRLTSEGRLRECLSREGSLSLRDRMRAGATDDELAAEIRRALYGKVDGHYYSEEQGHQHTLRAMSSIGG